MSSTVSTTDRKTIPRRSIPNPKMEDVPPRLVRSTSIEKIKRFNSFICSQQYYILPAILSWLKSSQPNLQTSTENTILIFRSVIFNTFFYRLFLSLKSQDVWTKENIRSNVEYMKTCVISNFYRKFSKCFESTFLLTVSVYTACAVIVCQLIFSLYFIYCTIIPYGLVFLMVCMLTIKYICYKTMFNIVPKCDIRDK